MTKTKPMTDEWQTIFLNAGTEKGLGDLSMMIGVVSEIIAQATSRAREEERSRIKNEWLRITEGAEDLAKNLEIAYGEGLCKICGCDPIHQRQFFLSLIQKDK